MYAPVPPAAVAIADPSETPQDAEIDERFRVKGGGSAIFDEARFEQLLLSVMVSVYVPPTHPQYPADNV